MKSNRFWWLLALLVWIVCIAATFIMRAKAQPMPPPLPPLTATIKWDHLPAWEFYRAVDTNDNPVPLMYRVYYATNVNGPWEVRAETTNNVAIVTNVARVTGFFYVTSSNVFLESDRSDLLALPMDQVKSPTFLSVP